MSGETWSLEDRCRSICDQLYQHLGWRTEKRTTGKENRDYDILVNGIRHEEKLLSFDSWQAYELMQATELLEKCEIIGRWARVPVTAIGNQFTSKASRQIWVCLKDEGVSHIYRINSKQEWNWLFVDGHAKTFPLTWVPPACFGGPRGSYGWTICLRVPWRQLIESQITTVLYSGNGKGGTA